MDNLISIVIPVYNGEKTIRRCVESVQNQTYSNLEIIVVNDGSTDKTLEILGEISASDNRVKIITIPNGGVSHARNTGIDNATGKYITFADSDDTVKQNMYEQLMNLIKKYNVRIAHCSYSNFDHTGAFISDVGNQGKEILQSHDEALECLLSGRYFTGGLWNKLYSRDLFDGIRLDEKIKINEDVLANYLLFEKVDKSVYTDLCLYNYFNYPGSSTSTTDGVQKCKETHYVTEVIYNSCKGKKYEQAALNRLARAEAMLLRLHIYNRIRNKEERKQLKKNVKDYIKKNCYQGKNQLFSTYLLLYCPFLFKLVYFIYDKIRVEKWDPEQ